MPAIEHQSASDDELNSLPPGSNPDISPQIANYRIRYVELTKPIAGALVGLIDYEIAHVTRLTDSSLMIIGFTIANFLGWCIGELLIHRFCLYFNLYKESKSKNPLFRTFKTLASLGTALGIILALATPQIDLKLSISIYSASLSFICGLGAFAWRWYRQSLPCVSEEKKNIDTQVGTDGWSKYARVALLVGTSMGQSIGAYVSYTAGSDSLTSWTNITLYGAIAATVSFVAVIVLVPVVNYVTRGNHETARGILVASNKDVFNTSYIRAGMTLGVSIGTILGGLLAPIIIPGLNAASGIALGAGVFSILSGLVLGIYGYKITLYLHHHWGVPINTDNSWSYASRNTSYVFGFVGTAVACVLCPGAALLQAAAIGSSLSGLVGWFAGFGVIWKARQLERHEQKSALPWTQRIATGASRGSIMGAFAGLLLGAAIGGVISLIALITFCGAVGGLVGAVKDGMNDAHATRLASMLFMECEDIVEEDYPEVEEDESDLSDPSGYAATWDSAIPLGQVSGGRSRSAPFSHGTSRHLLFASSPAVYSPQSTPANNSPLTSFSL